MAELDLFCERTRPFLEYLFHLPQSWETLLLERLFEEAGGPQGVAFLGIDLVKGFCTEGPLASPRVGALLKPVARILSKAEQLGARQFLFPCDSHPPESLEFRAFPPHCLKGTREAELAEELQALPFSRSFRIFPKACLDAMLGTELEVYLAVHPEITRLVCLGDCTDLCVYHAAMHLRLYANAHHRDWEVVVPASAVDTFDLPQEVAAPLGAMPHDAEFLHRVFLYQMQLNGIRVVADLI